MMSDTATSPVLVPASATGPKTFYWGAATAAFQIEGSPQADGAGRCIWDEFSHTPGNVHNGENGDIACDHYNRWADDIELMKSLGLGAYRFSIRWPRVLPDGTGRVNAKGLSFYDRLVDGLLEAGIEPCVTLFHWDLPAALQRRGGWANRDMADWFSEYTETVVGALGDRVRFWMTLNEPHIFAWIGNLVGEHAPGVRNLWTTFHTIHNELRAHAGAARVIKAARADAEVGLALSCTGITPASSSAEDQLAATLAHQWQNFPLFLEPLTSGRYPAELESRIRQYLPAGYEDDMGGLVEPPEVVGVNYYSGYRVTRDPSNWLGIGHHPEPDMPRTEMGWIVRPEGLHQVLTRLHDEYAPARIFITENGAAFEDVREGSVVDDPRRRDYIEAHVRQVLRAREDGIPVDGYFAWSLMDNFEWAFGYSRRFGIVYVDFETQERIVKSSGRWYGEVARSGGAILG